MSDDSRITVTALDRVREFDSVEELSAHVTDALEARGGIISPTLGACIRKLASLANGQVPPRVRRVARQTRFHSPGRAAEREDTPFSERIEELEEEAEGAEAAHEAARAAVFAHHHKINEAERGQVQDAAREARSSSLGRPPRRHREASEELERLRAALPPLEERERETNRAAVRARAALGKAKLAADRWRRDTEARFVVGPPDDRQVVDGEGLRAWISDNR